MATPHLGDVRRGPGAKYYIYEFAGCEKPRWSELQKLLIGQARGTRHPDSRTLKQIEPSERTRAYRAARRDARATLKGPSSAAKKGGARPSVRSATRKPAKKRIRPMANLNKAKPLNTTTDRRMKLTFAVLVSLLPRAIKARSGILRDRENNIVGFMAVLSPNDYSLTYTGVLQGHHSENDDPQYVAVLHRAELGKITQLARRAGYS